MFINPLPPSVSLLCRFNLLDIIDNPAKLNWWRRLRSIDPCVYDYVVLSRKPRFPAPMQLPYPPAPLPYTGHYRPTTMVMATTNTF